MNPQITILFLDDSVLRYITGNMPDEREVCAMFQRLIDTGRVWTMGSEELAGKAVDLMLEGKCRMAA